MITEEEKEFLFESNLIEGEPSKIALEDAIIAWEYAKSIMPNIKFNISVGDILKIHSLLMQRLNKKIAGRIREFSIYIGGDVRDQTKEEIEEELDLLVDDWNVDIKEHGKPEYMEKLVKEWHVWFEKIHPFADGNGRTGRILMNLQRINLGLPLLIIHHGPEQFSYYKWFREEKK